MASISGHAETKSMEFHLGLLYEKQGPSTSAVFSFLPRYISIVLSWNQSSQDLNRSPSGMLTLQQWFNSLGHNVCFFLGHYNISELRFKRFSIFCGAVCFTDPCFRKRCVRPSFSDILFASFHFFSEHIFPSTVIIWLVYWVFFPLVLSPSMNARSLYHDLHCALVWIPPLR